METILRKNEKQICEDEIKEKECILDSLYKRRYHRVIEKGIAQGLWEGSGAGKGEIIWGKSG
ncbi:hypothetical protein [Hungatella effluvii]|uniref:hypothetical protein n=1 Tax=Hungatella effluvii TaxID=1096246 RepID=UPI0022E1C242|nr:hypothetical protein [Hungatella effluvii]